MNDVPNISKPSGSTLGWGNIPIYGTVGGGSVAPTPLPGQLSGVPGIFDSGGGVNLTNYFKAIGQHDPYGQTGGTNTTTSVNTPPGQYTKPPGWSDAQFAAWQAAARGGGDLMVNPLGATPSTTPTTTPSTTPTTPPTTPPTTTPTDPFTSWLNQQNVFPYTQSTLGMSGWNPAGGYNPAAAGYNPSAMPNYTMDTYP